MSHKLSVWFASLCFWTLKVLTVVQADPQDDLEVTGGMTLKINTENLTYEIVGFPSNNLNVTVRNCNASNSGAMDVAVLSIQGSIKFHRGSQINITGNRSLVIESIEGNILINTTIEMKCIVGRTAGKERCLGAYIEAEDCKNVLYAVKGPQWEEDKCDVADKRKNCLPGASHGGIGGRNKIQFSTLSRSYGTDDLKCMSGGSAGYSKKKQSACVGGGAIEIKAEQGNLIIGGMISASAALDLDSSIASTGCSGGLIRLIAEQVKMESGASLNVDGSNASSLEVGENDYFSGNGGGAGGVIQIFAPKGSLHNISLKSGVPYRCHESYINAENGVLWIKQNASDANYTYLGNASLSFKTWGMPSSEETGTQIPSLNNQSSPSLSMVFQELDSIKDNIVKNGVADDRLAKLLVSFHRLLNISRDNLTKQELLQYLDVFENFTEMITILSKKASLEQTKEIFDVLVEIATTVIGLDNLVTWKETEKMPQFLNTLERMALSISSSTNSSFFQSATKTIVVEMNQFTVDENEGLRFPKHDKLPPNSFISEQDYVYIPMKALPKTPEGYKMVVFFFKDIQSGLPTNSFQQLRGESKDSTFKVTSLLMSCSLLSNGVSIIQLQSPATLNFVVNQVKSKMKKEETRCAFWNLNNNSWDSEGVSVKSVNSSQTVCTTTHFTNFAVLMQHTPITLTEAEKLSLLLITYIGCGISIATLLISMIVFISMEALSSDRHRIHLNLVIALLLAQILFLTGIKATEHETLCKVIAGVLHYLYMVSFTWMLIEGVHLYLKVVKVFGIENIKIRQYYIIGWGLPALIVGVAAIIKPYGYGTNHVCWLSLDDGFVWAFLGPVIAIIAINIFILAAVIKTVVASASTMKSSDHSHIKAGIKGALVLMPLMGTTWVFGLLAVNRDTLIFQYIFSIANSLQGLLIFLLHVVFNNEVRLAFRRHYEKKQLSKESGDYNNSMSHSNESDNKLKTLGKSSSNSSMSGLVRLKARLSMSLMPRTSRVVTVQPINSIDKDDGLQVNRKFHQKSPSSEVSGLNSPSELDSYSKPPLHNPLRKGKNAGSRL